MLKKLFLTGATVILTTSAALAADMVEPAAYDWSGPYIGLQGGYGWDKPSVNLDKSPALGSIDQDAKSLGIEADVLRPRVIESLIFVMKMLELQGPQALARSYEPWAALTRGRAITWADGEKSGTVEGLGPAGELKVKLGDGSVVSLFAEDAKIRPASA